MSVVHGFWLAALTTSQKIGDQRYRQQDAKEISQRMWGFTSALRKKTEGFTMKLWWAVRTEHNSVLVCARACTFNGFPALNQCPVIICSVRNTYGNLSRKRQYEQFHKGPTIGAMLSKTSVSDGNRCMWTILHEHTYTNFHKHTARYTHAITERGRDYNIFSPQPD